MTTTNPTYTVRVFLKGTHRHLSPLLLSGGVTESRALHQITNLLLVALSTGQLTESELRVQTVGQAVGGVIEGYCLLMTMCHDVIRNAANQVAAQGLFDTVKAILPTVTERFGKLVELRRKLSSMASPDDRVMLSYGDSPLIEAIRSSIEAYGRTAYLLPTFAVSEEDAENYLRVDRLFAHGTVQRTWGVRGTFLLTSPPLYIVRQLLTSDSVSP